jgi:hypothetical protein
MTSPKWDAAIVTALSRSDWWERAISPRLVHGDGDCLDWSGALIKGYGVVSIPARFAKTNSGGDVGVRVHRVAYLRAYGDVVGDLDLDHLCRRRLCANVTHLDPKTCRENLLAEGASTRAAAGAASTHCPRCGLPLSDENLIVTKRGHRACRYCQNQRSRERDRLICDAHTAMGMQQREYRDRFGKNKLTAHRVLDLLADGTSPREVIALLGNGATGR